MWNGLNLIEGSLVCGGNSTSWRVDRDLYYGFDWAAFRPGTVSLAPAWYQQGHEVRLFELLRGKTINQCTAA